MKTGGQGWGKAQDWFLPPPYRNGLGGERSYQSLTRKRPCQ